MRWILNAIVCTLLLAACVDHSLPNVTKKWGPVKENAQYLRDNDKREFAAIKKANDAFYKLISGRGHELDSDIESVAKQAGRTVSIDNISKTLDLITQHFGRVIVYQYCDIAIETKIFPPSDRDIAKGIPSTCYAVRTTKHPNSDLYFTIKITQLNSELKVERWAVMDYKDGIFTPYPYEAW